MKKFVIALVFLTSSSVFAGNFRLLPIQSRSGEPITHQTTRRGMVVTVFVEVPCGFKVEKVIFQNVSDRSRLSLTEIAVLALGKHLPKVDCPPVSPGVFLEHHELIENPNAGHYKFTPVQPSDFFR